MESIYNLMKTRLEEPDMSFFRHYRDDFFVHDCRELVQWGSPHASYLWFVRESGSDLIRLNVCAKHAERGHALLNGRDWSQWKIFHARSGIRSGSPVATLVEVTPLAARDLLDAKPAYERNAGQVTYLADGMRSEIAQIRVVWERGCGMPKAHVKCDMASPTLDHVTALRLLSFAEVVQDSGSLLTPVESIRINGEQIRDMTARLRLSEAREQYRRDTQHAARRNNPSTAHF